jgi:hypothetical protein
MSMITRSSKTGSAEGLRNRFFARKRMLAEDFKIEQDYFINSQRLINRAVLGWGVVYGFKIEGATLPAPCGCGDEKPQDVAAETKENAHEPVTATPAKTDADMQQTGPYATSEGTDVHGNGGGGEEQKPKPFPLVIGPGFALDASGRHLVLRQTTTLTPENTILLIPKGSGWVASEIVDNLKTGHYVLAVHYTESKAGGTVSASLCCCGEPERTHLCEGVMFSLRQVECPCGEPNCAPDDLCVCDSCCNGNRGPHARLAAWATGREDEAADELCQWHDVEIARGEGVDLACIIVDAVPDKCKPISVSMVDESSPRRVVKTSDTLYDLLNGRDLTRIESVSWWEWHRKMEKMPWETFAGFFTSNATPGGELLTNFTVRFSGPVKSDSIRRDTVAITVQMADGGTGWIKSRRLPLRDPDLTPKSQKLPPGTTDQFTVTVDRRWFRDEIDTLGESYLSERNFMVEIEIRGDLIVDCSGQAVDANAVGVSPAPSGNGTPGGSYLSTFMVKRMARPAGSGD